VASDINECASVLELKGTLRVQLTLTSDGKATFKLLAPFDKGEASLCFKTALKKAVFPKFKKGKAIPVDYPFVLHP
jgi:hypothetical protein